YVMVVLKGSVPMAFGGTQEPAAYGELVSIGGLNPDVNKKLSAGIASILESKLSVPKSRFYLKFYDSKAHPAQENAQCLHALHQDSESNEELFAGFFFWQEENVTAIFLIDYFRGTIYFVYHYICILLHKGRACLAYAKRNCLIKNNNYL
ncbi:hypothetical protein ACJX0J_021689, partial [Zea mays]